MDEDKLLRPNTTFLMLIQQVADPFIVDHLTTNTRLFSISIELLL